MIAYTPDWPLGWWGFGLFAVANAIRIWRRR